MILRHVLSEFTELVLSDLSQNCKISS